MLEPVPASRDAQPTASGGRLRPRGELVFPVQDAVLTMLTDRTCAVWLNSEQRADCVVDTNVAQSAVNVPSRLCLLGPASGRYTAEPILNNWWHFDGSLFCIPRLAGRDPDEVWDWCNAFVAYRAALDEGRLSIRDVSAQWPRRIRPRSGHTSFYANKGAWSSTVKSWTLWADGMHHSVSLTAEQGAAINERQHDEPCLALRGQFSRIHPPCGPEALYLWAFRDTWWTTEAACQPAEIVEWINDYYDLVLAGAVQKQQREAERALIQRAERLAEKKRAESKLAWAKATLDLSAADTLKRPGIPRDVRLAVFERDGGACVECGETFELQFDHIIPFSLGGASTIENLQVLCGTCNRGKGASLG